MRGKRKNLTREIAPDPKFGNVLLAKFTNYLMVRGKKSIAQTIIYSALETIATNSKKDPIKVFEEAVQNLRPQVEVRSRRVGGANYQVPLPVRGERQNALAFRWIIGAARAKKGQRDDVHRMAEANKAFAHFARFAR